MVLKYQIFTMAGEEFVRAKADISPDCKQSFFYKVYGKVKIAQKVCLFMTEELIRDYLISMYAPKWQSLDPLSPI